MKTLNLRFAKGSETLNEIIKVQCSPFVKIGLGYIIESSQSSTPSYLNLVKASQQHFFTQQKNKETTWVKHDHFISRKNNNRNINQRVNINRRFHDRKNFFFNGQCFSCHNFGHKVVQCLAYKTIMTREARKKINETGVKKNYYNKFSPLQE